MSEFSDKLRQFVNLEVKDDNDYIKHLQFIKDNCQHWDDEDVADVLGKMLVYYFEANRRLVVDDEKPEASDKMKKIYRQYEDKLTSQNKVDMLQNLSMIVLHEDEKAAYHDEYAKVKEIVNEIYYISTDEIYRDINNKVMTAFSFRPFSMYALKDICLNEITLCNPDRFNDPFDTLFPHWIDYELNKQMHDGEQSSTYKYLHMLKDSIQSIRCRSLVLANRNNVKKLNKLMWAHYADEHKGFCIKYKIDKEFFYSNLENKSVLACFKMNYINDTFSFDEGIRLSKALMSKCNIWRYENEFRIFLFNPEIQSDFKSLPLNEHFRMTDIYLGLRCQEDDQRMMEELLQDKPIRLHRMKEKIPYAYRLDWNNIKTKTNKK